MDWHESEKILKVDDLEKGPHSPAIYLQESYGFLMEKSPGEKKNKQTNKKNLSVLSRVVGTRRERGGEGEGQEII